MDLARQLVERHATALLRPHFKALGLMLHDDGSTTLLEGGGAVVVHQGEATTIEDLGAQISAARELLDRVYGKPRQQQILTGADGGPIEVIAQARAIAEGKSRAELEAMLGLLDEPDAFLLGADTADGLG